MAVVLHLGLLPILSGVQNVMIQILEAIAADGYEIKVATAPDGPLIAEIEKRGWKHIPIPSLVREINPLKDWQAVRELAKILKEEEVDILHTHSSKTGLLGRMVGRSVKVPTIIHTVHGYPFHKYQNKILYAFYVLAEMWAGKFCDYLVSVNAEDAELAHSLLKIPKHKIKFIPNGAVAFERREILQNEEIVIGTMSRFWKQKNMLKTVQIAIKSCELINNLKFIFVGDGEDLAKCQELVAEAKLEKRIILPGWSSEKEKWLNMFDIFILYSLWEGLPLSILEAMSYGLPIIASDIKGNRELVDSTNGFLIKVEAEQELLDLLVNLDKQREKLIEMGMGSFNKVAHTYSMDYFNKNYRKLYKEIGK